MSTIDENRNDDATRPDEVTLRKRRSTLYVTFGLALLAWSIGVYGWGPPGNDYGWGMAGGAGGSMIVLGVMSRWRRLNL